MNIEELREQVAAALPDSPIVVALGGGADSAVAAWACATHPRVRAVFVHHGLEATEMLKATAEKLAEVLDLELTVLRAIVEDGPNLEARARKARWLAIGGAVGDGETVVTGHSRDDLAETVLINLLRGAGSAGLAAMSMPRTDVIRPLLGYDRAELRSAAERIGLPFADDPANDRTDLLRNRLRADLIPQLGDEYEPAVRTTLARSSLHLAADDAVLEAAAAEIPIRADGEASLIPAAVLLTVSRPVAARVVRRALRGVNPPYAGSSDDVEAVLRVAAGEQRRITIGSALTAAREGPYVAVWSQEPSIPDPIRLESPGRVLFGEWVISATPARVTDLATHPVVLLDPQVFAGSATVRAAEPGERIDIDTGSKLVRDALAEAGVPLRKRPAWPVMADGARIAAIVTGRVAPWARPRGDDAVAVTRERT